MPLFCISVANANESNGVESMSATNLVCLVITVYVLVRRFVTADNVRFASLVLRTAFAC